MNCKTIMVLLVFICLFFPLQVPAQTCMDLKLLLAEKDLELANFDQALRWCNEAIGDLRQSDKPFSEKRRFFSKAYYLKAYTQMSMGASKQDVIKEIVKARLFDPDNKPDEKQGNHPWFSEMMNGSKAVFVAEPDTMYDICFSFFVDEDYCSLEQLLIPVIRVFSENNRLQKLMKETQSRCSLIKKSKLPTMGFFPVLFRVGDSSVAEKIEINKIAEEFSKKITSIRMKAIDEGTVKKLMNDLQVKNISEFVVKRGMTYVEFGETPDDVAIQYSVKEALLPRLEKKMKKIFKQLQLDYIFLIKVEKSEFGGMPKMNFNWCIFGKKDSKNPVLMYDDRHLNVKKDKSRYKKMSFLFKDFLERSGEVQ